MKLDNFYHLEYSDYCLHLFENIGLSALGGKEASERTIADWRLFLTLFDLLQDVHSNHSSF